jgi:hypothetical protein
MRVPSAAPALARAAAIGLAAAAILVLTYTAVLSGGGGHGSKHASARPTSPIPSDVSSTVPGSIALPTAAPKNAGPAIPAAQSTSALAKLAGKWTLATDKNTFFQFKPDGSGNWTAFGNKLWTGKAVPKNATTFDLSWAGTSQDESYWQVRLTSGGKKLYFEGNQQTFVKT